MSETITPKTQEEWLEHFKELAKEHGEMLAQPLVDYFADKILLARKEVEEAIEGLQYAYEQGLRRWGCFGNYDQECFQDFEDDTPCFFCKKLTQFVKEGEDE